MFINIDTDKFTQDFFTHLFFRGYGESDLITLRDFFAGKDVKIDNDFLRICCDVIQGLYCTYTFKEVIDLNRFFLKPDKNDKR